MLFSAKAKAVAAISTMKGMVMVKPIGSRKYVPAYKGQMLKSGEWIKTKSGVFVAIIFLDGSNIKIQQETEVKISSYRMTAKELKTTLNLNKGQAWSNVASQGAAGEFKIATPTAVASVKGTEFDLEYDAENEETNLVVFEGEVSMTVGLTTILAQAMEASKNGAPVTKVKPNDLPTWQNKTDPKYTFKLKPDRSGKRKVGDVINLSIHIINAKSKIFNDSFSDVVTVESQNSDQQVSIDGSSWTSSVEVNINKGRGVVKVKSNRQGKSSVIVNSSNAESKIIEFNYFQSKTQKLAAQNKLASLKEIKGSDQIVSLVNEKNLSKSQVVNGSGNVDQVLQKLETGELVMDGEPIIIDNGDGTFTVKIKAKPR